MIQYNHPPPQFKDKLEDWKMIIKSRKIGQKPTKSDIIRFGIGSMSVSYVISHNYLQQCLKIDDPVIIIHKDDFEDLLKNPDKFGDFKGEYFEIIDVLNSWGKSS